MSTRVTRRSAAQPALPDAASPLKVESKLTPLKRTRSGLSREQDNISSKENTPRKNLTEELNVGDLGHYVWAKTSKVKGFAAWPAQVVKPETIEQVKKAKASGAGFRLLSFAGIGECEFVAIENICKFGHGLEHEKWVRSSRAKKFKEAVAQAMGDTALVPKNPSEEMEVANKKAKPTIKSSETTKGLKSDSPESVMTDSLLQAKTSIPAVDSIEDADVSAYEQLREENMRRNRAILESLELPSIAVEVKAGQGVKARGLGSKKRETEAAPARQRSLRLQGKDSEGHELPANFRDPVRFKPGGDASGLPEVERERRVGDVPFMESIVLERRGHDEDPAVAAEAARRAREERVEAFVDTLKAMRDAPREDSLIDSDYGAEAAYKSRLKALVVAERDVAKVVPDRIFSIAFHPSSLKTLIFAGDKCGRIGMFDPDGAEDEACVTLHDVHSRPVTALLFDPRDHSRLLSTSYDNTVRIMDLNHQKWIQVHESDEEKLGFLSTAYLDYSRDCLLGGFGKSPGLLSIQDIRGGAPTIHSLHDKTIRCIHISPTDPNLLMTGSIDGTVKLWDFRKVSGGAKSQQALYSLEHGKGVTAAYFNRTGTLAVTTSFDDTIRVIDVAARTQRHSIDHNNQTGRWLTPFRATFDPKTDFAVAVGSMAQPRGVDVYNAVSGRRLVRLEDPNFASVTSLNCFHPHRNMLAGGNSSGKVLLWRTPS